MASVRTKLNNMCIDGTRFGSLDGIGGECAVQEVRRRLAIGNNRQHWRASLLPRLEVPCAVGLPTRWKPLAQYPGIAVHVQY